VEASSWEPDRRADAVAAALRRAVPTAASDLLEFAREQVLLAERHESLLSAATIPSLECPVVVLVSDDVDEAERRRLSGGIACKGAVHAVGAGHFSMMASPAVEQIARYLTGPASRSWCEMPSAGPA
jgi:hypothetical protein